MTYEQMLAMAEKIKAALAKELRADVETLEHSPGDSIPIAFTDPETGDEFVLELNSL